MQKISPTRRVIVGNCVFDNTLPFVLIAGPCVLESRAHAMEVAAEIYSVCQQLSQPFIFKTSFDKANRTSIQSARGIGLRKACDVFDEIKATFQCPVLTDVHEPAQCKILAHHVDVLQIPAFLCRQTDLISSAARTAAAINIKKGQFLAPWDMQHAVQKAHECGNMRVLATERGTSFGYNRLVVDMTGLHHMSQTLPSPLIFDATHAVQQPGGEGPRSGGNRQYVMPLARAALSIGVAGLFIETHPSPNDAPSDGPNMLPLQCLKSFLQMCQAFDQLAKKSVYPSL